VVGGTGSYTCPSPKTGRTSHAAQADPVANSVSNGGRCPTTTSPAGPGTAVYDSEPLPQDYTMLGLPRLHATHTGTGEDIQLNARIYDVFPDGTAVMMDRGVRRVTLPNGTTTFPIQGNGWRFAQGHRIRIELTQNDAPYVRHSNQPSSLLITNVKLEVPVREGSATMGGAASGATPPGVDLTAPRLASDSSRDPRFVLGLRSTAGDLDHYELEVRNIRSTSWKRLSSSLRSPSYSFAGYFGSAYRFRARAVGRFGERGGWDYATTVVPFDDSRRRGKPAYGRGWSHVTAKSAWGQGLSRTAGRGRVMRMSFSGAGTLYLIGRRSPSGGRAAVFVDGKRRGVVSFRNGSARNRALVKALTVKGGGRHLLRLVTLGGRVEIDGVGVATR
jgi:hypothetical protein